MIHCTLVSLKGLIHMNSKQSIALIQVNEFNGSFASVYDLKYVTICMKFCCPEVTSRGELPISSTRQT